MNDTGTKLYLAENRGRQCKPPQKYSKTVAYDFSPYAKII
jgi:hypothetical protein